jgi:hypothetical protein
MPADKIRPFATWFYQLKCNLLQFEITRDGIPAYQWEKKGSALYTTNNVLKYKELRQATFRLFNRIEKDGGIVFYVGVQKTHAPEAHNPKNLYRAILRESIKRLDQFCADRDAEFMMILDCGPESARKGVSEDFRTQIVTEASIQMFAESRSTMVEPPIQAESHLFQTIQCADWLCGLVGRVGCYDALPGEYPELDWTAKYFVHRLKRVAPCSGIRKEKSPRTKEI